MNRSNKSNRKDRKDRKNRANRTDSIDGGFNLKIKHSKEIYLTLEQAVK